METSWKTVTGNLYKGVLIQVWCNIAAAIFAFIAVISAVGDLASGDLFGAVVWGFWDWMELVASIGALYGFWVFFSNINPWKVGSASQILSRHNRIETSYKQKTGNLCPFFVYLYSFL